ncbi:MAG: hypothetical protein A2096_11775 [Spirochaetes bacterium GWF1_41_5]|nr:MAG: hypothetical protein A2096_11775 [Spirochaetes bacterium GWF1_41_5]
MATLESALKNAIQITYQLEDDELASEALPDANNRKMILFYEASEGGAGILKQLTLDPLAMNKVARTALEICHFDPETGADLLKGPRAKEECKAACYDCLMSYFNQQDHQYLDRHLIKDYLLMLSRSKIDISPVKKSRDDHYNELKRACMSELEVKWLDYIYGKGLRLPDHAQAVIQACKAKPDFIYANLNTVIYIDGHHHEYPDRQKRDREQENLLEDRGYLIIRFDYKDNWEKIVKEFPNIFGVKS